MSLDLAKPQPPPRKSSALGWVIRITGLCLALVSFAGFVVSVSLILRALERHVSILATVLGGAAIFLFAVLFVIGYRMLRQVSHVTVANFCFILASVLTALFTLFMSEGIIEAVGETMGMKGDGWNWLYHPDLPLLRIVLALVAFLSIYYLVKLILVRLLGLHHPPPKPGK